MARPWKSLAAAALAAVLLAPAGLGRKSSSRLSAGLPRSSPPPGPRAIPRRGGIGAAPHIQPEWKPLLPLVGIGGAILFASTLLYFAIIAMTAFASKREAVERPAFAEALSGPADAPAFLDRLAPWVGAALVLILLAYGPTLWHLALDSPFSSPGFRVW